MVVNFSALYAYIIFFKVFHNFQSYLNVIFRKKYIMWKYYALLSAYFAALTAIFAKIGVKDIDSNLATAIRTTIIPFITWGIVLMGNHARSA